MAVRIRLTRTGRKNFPSNRIAVFDGRTRRDGKYLENLGTYNPREKDDLKKVVVKIDRLKYWISKGAQPTEALKSIFKKCEIKIK